MPGGGVEADDHLVISRVEPRGRNAAAIGLDLGSESNRRSAALAAWDRGDATTTGIIQLVQDALATPGFPVLVPVRGEGKRWVHAPIIGHQVFDGVLRHAGSEMLIAVRDTGIGISGADRPRLFRRFAQLATSEDHRLGGSGLGLALSMELAALHSGSVEVESDVGVGSRFTFVLPRQPHGGGGDVAVQRTSTRV